MLTLAVRRFTRAGTGLKPSLPLDCHEHAAILPYYYLDVEGGLPQSLAHPAIMMVAFVDALQKWVRPSAAPILTSYV